jgi:hypothetical protein
VGPEDYQSIWPRLRLISCWADAHAALHAESLRQFLPRVPIQPKGLIATEAFVTLPFAGRHPLAVLSHFFEFVDHRGDALLAHELKTGAEYRVVVTTGGGLYRYCMQDRVRVDGRVTFSRLGAYLHNLLSRCRGIARLRLEGNWPSRPRRRRRTAAPRGCA